MTQLNGFIGAVSSLFNKPKRSAEHHEIVRRLNELGHSTNQVANTILAIMVASVGLSLTLTNVINLYLGSDQDATMKKLAHHDDPQAFIGFVYEGLRKLIECDFFFLMYLIYNSWM
jgi:linoleate 10R-lipoxygenase